MKVKTNGSSDAALRAEVAGLREQVMALTARLQSLEGTDSSNGDGHPASRRDILKLAGALAAGAAGGLVLRPLPAAAATGGAFTLGQANDADATTSLTTTAAATQKYPSPQMLVEALHAAALPADPMATSKTNRISLPVLMVVAPYGVFPTTGGATPTPIFPGLAPLQSVGGPVDSGTAPVQHVAEGVDGFAALDNTDVNARSAGVVGGSDFGIGVVGFGVTDLAAFGDGYIAQTPITDNTGTPIAGPPPSPVYDFEQARDKNGVLWVSTVSGAWRRLNSVIPVTPFRLYDSRPNARPANSLTDITVAGVGSIPADAIGVFGNLTALGPQADGFAIIYPKGASTPNVNTLNYTRGISALSNHFMVPLGTGGQVEIYVSGNGSTNLIVDVQGYLQ